MSVSLVCINSSTEDEILTNVVSDIGLWFCGACECSHDVTSGQASRSEAGIKDYMQDPHQEPAPTVAPGDLSDSPNGSELGTWDVMSPIPTASMPFGRHVEPSQDHFRASIPSCSPSRNIKDPSMVTDAYRSGKQLMPAPQREPAAPVSHGPTTGMFRNLPKKRRGGRMAGRRDGRLENGPVE